MWDPYGDDPSRHPRPRPGEPEPDEPWVADSGPRAPSARSRAVVLAVVAVAVLVSLFLACVLIGELLALFGPVAPR